MIDIKALDPAALESALVADGFEKYRAKQIAAWLKAGATSFDEMKNLPAKLRSYLSERYVIPTAVIEKKRVSQIDGTVKYLFRLNDGEFIESVVMQYHHGTTICISTQVGSSAGCRSPCTRPMTRRDPARCRSTGVIRLRR